MVRANIVAVIFMINHIILNIVHTNAKLNMSMLNILNVGKMVKRAD